MRAEGLEGKIMEGEREFRFGSSCEQSERLDFHARTDRLLRCVQALVSTVKQQCMPASGAVYDRSRYFTEKMRGRTIVHGGGFARGFVVIALGGAGCLKDGSST